MLHLTNNLSDFRGQLPLNMPSHRRKPASTSTGAPSLRNMLAGFLLVASCLVPATRAFYLPGSAPRSFAPGDPVPLLVNALSPQISSKKRLQSLLPYDYYNPAFHFCRPGDGKTEPKKVSESLGSVLFGDRLYESPFEVRWRLKLFRTGRACSPADRAVLLGLTLCRYACFKIRHAKCYASLQSPQKMPSLSMTV